MSLRFVSSNIMEIQFVNYLLGVSLHLEMNPERSGKK